MVEATEPDCDALESQPSPYELCPYGPCCSGEDCCVVSLGEYSQLIKSPNYPYDSGRNKSCAWTLAAPEGWLVALNFYDMQMRQDTGSQCNNDYVMISDPHNSAHSVFEPSGRRMPQGARCAGLSTAPFFLVQWLRPGATPFIEGAPPDKLLTVRKKQTYIYIYIDIRKYICI